MNSAMVRRKPGELMHIPVEVLMVPAEAGHDDVHGSWGKSTEAPQPRRCRMRDSGLHTGLQYLREKIAVGRIRASWEREDIVMELAEFTSVNEPAQPVTADAG
jgi:hypothetical protein